MSMREELKEERKKLKGKPFSEKFNWFMHYYKWAVIGPIAVVLIIIYISKQTLNEKGKPTIQCVFLNQAETLQLHPLTTMYGSFVNMENQMSPLYTTTYLMRTRVDGTLDPAYMGLVNDLREWEDTGSVDCIFADASSINYLASSGLICDLNKVLTEEQIAEYKDYICYVDYKNPSTGETTRYAVGFYVQNTDVYQKCGGPADTEYILCTVMDPPHYKNIYRFIQFMFS